jgi:hypothetical protein
MVYIDLKYLQTHVFVDKKMSKVTDPSVCPNPSLVSYNFFFFYRYLFLLPKLYDFSSKFFQNKFFFPCLYFILLLFRILVSKKIAPGGLHNTQAVPVPVLLYYHVRRLHFRTSVFRTVSRSGVYLQCIGQNVWK